MRIRNKSWIVLVLLLLSLVMIPVVMGSMVDVVAGYLGVQQYLSPPKDTILLIGDSHVVNYGESLHKSFQDMGFHTYIYGCSGTNAFHYVNGLEKVCRSSLVIEDALSPEKNNLKLTENYFKDRFNKINPSVIIFSFGTNYLGGAGVDRDKDSINSLLNIVRGRKCFWVGAPVSNKLDIHPTEINARLVEIIGNNCEFIDSSKISGLTNDLLPLGGFHFYPEGYKIWANALHRTIVPLSGFISRILTVEDIEDPQITLSDESPSSGEEETEQSPASSVTAAVGTTACNNLCIRGSQCKQIDDAWRIIVPLFNKEFSNKNKVWCSSQTWEAYDKVYLPEAKVTTSQTDNTPVNGDYSNFINAAAGEVGVPPRLVAVFIRFESGKAGLKAESATGCRGLMGVCNWDTNYANFKAQYPGVDIKDEPFDPKANIYVGSYILSLNYKWVSGCKEGDDELKCVIASYNAGAGLINSAAKEVSPQGNAAWEDIITQLQDEEFVEGIQRYSDEREWTGRNGVQQKWTDSQRCKATIQNRRMCKMYHLRYYVNNVFNSVSRP